MADTAAIRETHDVAPDVLGVKSRVSWGAILAGAAIALACYIALSLLFAAIGVSLTETNVRSDALGWGVLVAMILSMVVSLFLGGWVASQLTAGENRQEAVLYGLLTWATVVAISICMVFAGAKAGYFAAVGGAMVAQNNERIPAWEDAARRSGLSEAQINSVNQAMDPAQVRADANDPANRERARQTAIAAAWSALVATMLSMAAAVGGAVTGRGLAFRLFPSATVIRREGDGPRLIIPTA